MNEIATLIEETNNFFQKYWNIENVGAPPQWSEVWKFRGAIPSYDRCGCYALFITSRPRKKVDNTFSVRTVFA